MEPKRKRRFNLVLLAGTLVAVLLYSCSGPSTSKLLKQHLGIESRSEIQRVKAKHQSYGFEWDAWIYLEATTNRIERLLRDQSFVAHSGAAGGNDPIVFVTFSEAPTPPSRSDGRLFKRRRQGGILDYAVVGPGSTQLWFRALRY